jgi:hypothetical protein
MNYICKKSELEKVVNNHIVKYVDEHHKDKFGLVLNILKNELELYLNDKYITQISYDELFFENDCLYSKNLNKVYDYNINEPDNCIFNNILINSINEIIKNN